MWVVLTQQKKGVPAPCWRRMKSFGGVDELVVAGLHALLGQGPGVLDALLADPPPARLLGRIVLLGCPAVQDAPRAEALAEPGKSSAGG